MSAHFLKSPSEEPSSSAACVGVSICVSDPRRGLLHAGLLTSDPDDFDEVIHHGWHQKTYREPRDKEKWWWVELDLGEERAEAIIGQAQRIHQHAIRAQEQKKGIGFAFRFDKTTFDSVGSLVLGENESGLTCAAFVLAVLRSAQIELVDVPSWQIRPGDTEWQKLLSGALLDSVEDEHDAKVALELAKKLIREIGAPRFRPSQVLAAASLYEANPVLQSATIPRAERVHQAVLA